jgi:RNA polymerase sigma factor (sigma-70 family)
MEEIYWAHVRWVEAWVRARLRTAESGRGIGADDLENLVQEIFVAAFRDKVRMLVGGRQEYGAFLLSVARNVAADWAGKRALDIEPDDFEALVAAATSAEENDEPWTDEDTAGRVEAYLRTLSADLAAVHHERYVLGHTQRAAAKLLGLSRHELEARENRIREGLDLALRGAREK